ncbi:hypothetical protein BpHYR1_008429 [Brachionus plicatilis]|uniref:Uncharacterized protein n=1 Tax=Brachionus plicatilis TaxID=10195 RepID=A0A3M7SBK7_BRAPC|nr:hypothetical protein BpHYR1_008429 [Brachionus plicatilis]
MANIIFDLFQSHKVKLHSNLAGFCLPAIDLVIFCNCNFLGIIFSAFSVNLKKTSLNLARF